MKPLESVVLIGLLSIVPIAFAVLVVLPGLNASGEADRFRSLAGGPAVAQAEDAGERLTLDLQGAAAVYVQDEAGESYTYVVTAPADLNARFAERWIARSPPGGAAAADVRAAGTGSSPPGAFAVARGGDYECWMDWSNARAGDRVAGSIVTVRAGGRLVNAPLGDVRASADGAGRSAPRGVTFSPGSEAVVSLRHVPDDLEWRVACRRAE